MGRTTVWARLKALAEKLAGFIRFEREDILDCLIDPNFYGILVGALCFVSTHSEPLMVRLLLTALGFFGGWGFGAVLLLFVSWIMDSYEKHPAPWVLLCLVMVLYWLPL
ncbi:MAG: hypothetical protein ACRCS9_07035 [Hyphomicrobium sp.]